MSGGVPSRTARAPPWALQMHACHKRLRGGGWMRLGHRSAATPRRGAALGRGRGAPAAHWGVGWPSSSSQGPSQTAARHRRGPGIDEKTNIRVSQSFQRPKLAMLPAREWTETPLAPSQRETVGPVSGGGPLIPARSAPQATFAPNLHCPAEKCLHLHSNAPCEAKALGGAPASTERRSHRADRGSPGERRARRRGRRRRLWCRRRRRRRRRQQPTMGSATG